MSTVTSLHPRLREGIRSLRSQLLYSTTLYVLLLLTEVEVSHRKLKAYSPRFPDAAHNRGGRLLLYVMRCSGQSSLRNNS